MADAADWVDHWSSHRYSIHEHSVKVASDTILVMLWWKDEAQLLELNG